MATVMSMCIGVLVTLLGFLCIPGYSSISQHSDQPQYCSFFNNRAPSAQPGLKNCTWFKDNSCCMQQEIAATFGRVKPLKGASLSCQKYVNYLMCYICAPNQNIFYKRERLTVCETFCDALYDACNSAILKGSVIRNLYSSGREFCQSRRFEVATTGCFTFDVSLDTSGGRNTTTANVALVVAMFGLCVLLQCQSSCGPLSTLTCSVCRRMVARGGRKRGPGGRSDGHREKVTRAPGGEGPASSAGLVSVSAPHRDATVISPRAPSGSVNVKHRERPTDHHHNHLLHHPHQRSRVSGKRRVAMCRPGGKLPPWIDSALFAVVLFIFHLPQGTSALSTDDITMWAQMLSSELTGIAKKGLRYEEIQQLYDRAQYATEFVNGTAKVLEVREKLGTYFVSKKRKAQQLAESVRQLHDEWWTEAAQLRAKAGTYGHRWRRENVVLPDHRLEPPVLTDTTVGTPYVHLNDLDLDTYKDADISARLPERLFKYDRNYRRRIMHEHSTVKIPEDVPRDSQQVYDTVIWTSKLDKIFRRNRQDDPSLRWQYFGSSTGVHRVFPGHEWLANFIGFHEDYDPRTRPWYVAATSGPKDVVLVLDSSASMAENGSMGRMKSVAHNILGTLSKQDSVNVVVSHSEYWSTDGVYHKHDAEVLSCHKDNLVPASTSHLTELGSAIDNLVPKGGSDHVDAFQKAFYLLKNSSHDHCQSFVIFVTDGQSMDDDLRCSSGYYRYDEQNTKHYEPGELCEYDFDEVTHMVGLLQYQLHKRTHLFTFLTSDITDSQILPGRLACDNQGAMATVTSDLNTFRQMAPYFRFLEASSGAQSAVWTSPYLDKAGLGLLVTVSVPVYSNLTRKHLGVVGIDVPLMHIENIMRNDLWGSTYAFVIDSKDGSAIIHPFSLPAAQLLEDPTFIPIMHLETHNGEPKDFAKVLKNMEDQQTGHFKITQNAQRAMSVHNSLVWRPTEYSHYFYTDIPGSDYSFAFNLAQTDETFQYARDPLIDGPISYLHEMHLYETLQEELPGVWEELRPVNTYNNYPGLSVSVTHSVVKLAPRCFCNAAAYLEEGRPSFTDIHEYVNTFTPTYDIHCPRGTYRTDIRPDVKLTAQLEQLWRNRDATLQQNIAWTYIGTMGGVMRIYPGVEISRAFDPTTRPWYHRSEVNRGRLVVSGVYRDSVPNMGKVVTLSRAIHKAKPLTPPDCTGVRRGYGCPCTENHQCKSEYCYLNSCADDLIQGVVALDLRYPQFHDKIVDMLRTSGVRNYCNLRYSCRDFQACETRCYLVDDVGDLVYDASFVHIPDSEVDKYEHQSLATREGFVFAELVRRGIFIQYSRLDYQGVCKISESIPTKEAWEHLMMPDPYGNPDDPTMAPGPIPPFQNEYGCLKQVVYYETNKTYLRRSTLLAGTLDHSPCSAGKFYFMPVAKTNLFLLVLEDYHDLSTPVNLNCHIANRVRAPGSYRVVPNSCSEGMTAPALRPDPRVCTKPKTVPLPCGYSVGARTTRPPAGQGLLGVSLILTVWLIRTLPGYQVFTTPHDQ